FDQSACSVIKLRFRFVSNAIPKTYIFTHRVSSSCFNPVFIADWLPVPAGTPGFPVFLLDTYSSVQTDTNCGHRCLRAAYARSVESSSRSFPRADGLQDTSAPHY